jgi:ERCC4-type nuclease
MSKKEQVEVIIDSNEASQKPKLVEVLALHEDIADYEIKPLDEGDFIIDNCIFERKTPSDFASSLQEGRLRDQVERMADHEEIPFILIEGDMEDFNNLEHTDIPPKSLRGMDASIELRNNISVKYCSTIELLADEAVRLSRKEKEEVSVTQARQTDAVKETTFLERVFLAIEGIGPKTAESLSQQFESLSDAIESEADDFESVEGIGPETSEKIISSLHSQSHLPEKDEEQESKVYNI